MGPGQAPFALVIFIDTAPSQFIHVWERDLDVRYKNLFAYALVRIRTVLTWKILSQCDVSSIHGQVLISFFDLSNFSHNALDSLTSTSDAVTGR